MYQEKETAGNSYREEYKAGLDALLIQLQNASMLKRNALHNALLSDPEAFRNRIRSTLGWPLTKEARTSCPARITRVVQEDDTIISRVQLEIQPGLWMYGVFFQKDTETPLPLVIAQHGGQGTPELCSNFFGSENYNDMTRRIRAKGVHVLCPQLFLWDAARFSEGGSTARYPMDRALKHVGSSIAAIELDGLLKWIDWASTLPCVDADSIGMIGLSYGGFYTLYTAALDKRIKAALSSCYFNDKTKYNWEDWTWDHSGNQFQDAEVAALIFPRKLWIQICDKDHLFAADTAQQEFERLTQLREYTEAQLHLECFEGDHEFGPSDDGINFVVKALFGV